MNYANQLWNLLKSVRKITTTAVSYQHNHANGQLIGSVRVIENNHALLFFEYGNWLSSNGITTTTSNIYRWTLKDQFLYLEHLRYGENHPVLLSKFLITQSNDIILGSHHSCEKDIYMPSLNFNDAFLELSWVVCGSNKSDVIATRYGV